MIGNILRLLEPDLSTHQATNILEGSSPAPQTPRPSAFLALSVTQVYTCAMIQNERQLKITKSRLEGFRNSIAHLKASKRPQDIDLLLWKAEQDAILSTIEELEGEIKHYEHLKAGKVKTIKVASFDDVPKVLIQARIAQGLTQKDLAEKLGVREQQVQHDEEILYSSASLSRLKRVAEVLGLEVEGKAKLLIEG
jgi:DNA-binding XRE family transcriptional regulator